MRWTTNIFTRSVLAAGTAAIVIVASGSTSSQASSQVAGKPADLPISCTTVDGVPIVNDVCNTVDSLLPDAPLPSLPVPVPTLPPPPDLPVPSLPTDGLPLPLPDPTASSAPGAGSPADEIPAVVGEIVSILPPQVIAAAAPLLPVVAPLQSALTDVPLPALPVPTPSLHSVIPQGALPPLTLPPLTIPAISVPPIPGLSDNGVVDVNVPTQICGINVTVASTPIGIADCPTTSTATPTPTTSAATQTTAAAATTTCIAPETTAPATTAAPAVTNSSVPFQASSAKRTADVTNSSVLAPETTAPATTTAATTADGCPTGGSNGGQGLQAAGGPTENNDSGGTGSRGTGDTLPITGLSLIALLVAGIAALSWGVVARMLANKKLARTPA